MQNNFIIHEKANRYDWTGECFLSVKSFYGGKADYRVKQRQYQVDQSNFLILNECTRYRLTIDSTTKTESFCIFFSPGFVSEVFASLSNSDEKLLDFNTRNHDGIKLLETNYPRDGAVADLLLAGRQKSSQGLEALGKDEFYHHLLSAILYQNNEKLIDAERLSSKKKSTREELYQRIMYVKDFLDCNYYRDLRLSDLAAVGWLSENHLLRNFKQIFGRSPFQYISQKRINEAQFQICETDKPIREIAMNCGYSSFSNFSTYFKKVTGKSPTSLRKSDI